MPTSLASGTVTADGTEQVLATNTGNNTYVFVVDTATLINGETLELRIYTICLTSGAERLAFMATYTNAQGEPMKFSGRVPADISCKVTLKQTVYVTGYKEFPWKLLGVETANLIKILGTTLTETSAGYLTAAFKKLLDVASPTGTVNSLPNAVAGAAGGVAIVGSVMGKSPATLAAADVSGNLPAQVKAQDNIDFGALQKTSLNAATPASVQGAVASVAAAVTVGTNNDKTGYALTAAYDAAKTAAQPGADADTLKTLSDQLDAVKTDSAAILLDTGTDGVVIPQAQADKVWGTAARSLTDKAGFSLSVAGVQAIWDALTSALTTAGSIGKKLADWVIGTTQTGDSFARIGAAGAGLTVLAQASVCTEARLAELAAANLPADVDTIKGAVDDIGVAGAGLTALGDARLANLNATVSSRMATFTYTAPDSATTIAAAVWNYLTASMTTVNSIGKKLADWVVGTIDTYTGNTKQTGDAYALLGTVRGTDNDTLKTLSDQLDTAQADLDNPTQYKATGFATPTNVTDAQAAVIAALPDVSNLALEATLTAMKGAGWTTQTLVAISALVDDLEGRLTAARAGYLDELGAANIPADVDTLLTRLTALRAGYLDNLSGGAAALQASVDDLEGRLTVARAGYLDNLTNLDATVSTRALEAGGNVAAILEDTGTTIPGLIDALPTAAEVKTAMEVDGSKLDHIWETTEDDIGVRRFTVNALEQSPAGGSAPTVGEIADQVWNEAIADHLGAGSTGNALNAAGSAGDPWSTSIPGAYGAGSAGKILGDNVNATISSRSTLTAQQVWEYATRTLSSFGTLVSDAATAVWGAVTRSLTDKAGFTISGTKTTFDALQDPTVAAIADQVWDEAIAGHLGAGSTGNALNGAGAAGDPWSTGLPGAYGAGTAGKIIGDNLNAPVATVDTVVDAIKAKTDNLPADPAIEGNIQAHAAAALTAYDPPTRTEATADKAEIEALVEKVRKAVSNRLVVDPVTGTFTIYDDNGTTPLITGIISGTGRSAPTWP